MKMKTNMLCMGALGCSAMIFLAGPSEAPVVAPSSGCDGLRGSVGATLGYGWLNGSALRDDYDDGYASVLLELRLATDIGSSLYAQLDVLAEYPDTDSDANEEYDDAHGVAVHLMHKESSIGVFAGWFEAVHDDDSDISQRYIAGIEGLYEYSGIDLHWQVGAVMGEQDENEDGEQALHDAIFVRLAGDKQLNNGLRVGGEVAVAIGEMDDDANDVIIYGWSAHVEKRFNADWTMALVYNGSYYDQDEGQGNMIDHYLGVNATYYFGSGGDPEECKPGLGLPPIMRWLGLSGGMDAS